MLTRDEVRYLLSSSQHSFYVYLLIDDAGLPFYVGKGTAERCFAHEGEALYEENDREKHRIIRRLRAAGVGVRYEIASFHQSDDEAHDEERRLIELYGRRDLGTGILTNLTEGGEGHSREYPPEPFERDAAGIPIGITIEYPTSDQLRPPRFMRDDLPQMKWIPEHGEWTLSDEDAAGIAAERPNPSGPEMPTLAFWQYGGWTVQAFWSFSRAFDAVEVHRSGYAEFVDFRFFDFAKLLHEDRVRATAHTIVTPGRLVARILRTLAAEVLDNGTNAVNRPTKRLQAWCFHRRTWLQRFAEILESKTPPLLPKRALDDKLPDSVASLQSNLGVPITGEEFRKLAKLAWTAFVRHGLGERQFARFDQLSWRSLVLYHWAGLAPIDETFAGLYTAGYFSRHDADFRQVKLSTKVAIIRRWNNEFPSLAIRLEREGGSPGDVDPYALAEIEKDIRYLAREIANVHDNLSE